MQYFNINTTAGKLKALAAVVFLYVVFRYLMELNLKMKARVAVKNALVREGAMSKTANLNATQTATIDALVNAFLEQGHSDTRQLAVILSNVITEVGGGLRYDREEVGGPTFYYAPWYGRGLPQLTHKDNYIKFSEVAGVDLVANPNAIKDVNTGARVTVAGMMGYKNANGKKVSFRTKTIPDYINATKSDYYNSRQAINGHVADVYKKTSERAQYIAPQL